MEAGTAVVPAARQEVGVFVTGDPLAMAKQTASLAKSLQDFVREQGLTTRFGNSEHLELPAWQFIGAQLNVEAIVDPDSIKRVTVVKKNEKGEDVEVWGYVCNAHLYDPQDRKVGFGRGRCMSNEKNWKGSDEYAVESMATTRAMSRAYRSKLEFIAKAAGYEVQDASEMTGQGPTKDGDDRTRVKAPSPKPKQQPKTPPPANPEQRRKIMAKRAEAGIDDKTFEAMLQWVGGTGHIDRFPKAKVTAMLKAVADHEGTLNAIYAEAEQGDERATVIIQRYLADEAAEAEGETIEGTATEETEQPELG